jgi:hypothetical protein
MRPGTWCATWNLRFMGLVFRGPIDRAKQASGE